MDKWIDRLLETSWFLKVAALILALFLFLSVYDANNNSSIINVATRTDTATIENVPVTAYYDTENLVITGIPTTVDVKLTGPINLLQVAKIQKDFEVYVNLEEVQIGTSEVPIQIRYLSDKITAQLSQATAKVNVQEKITETYSVKVEYNPQMIAAGYEASEAIINPEKVSITGAKDVINQIAYVKATVDLNQKVNQTVEEKAEIIALDAKMNKLDVTIEPQLAEVVIPIIQLSKKVPLIIIEENTLPDSIIIESIELNQNEIEILGNKELLDTTSQMEVIIDLSSITDSGTYSLSLVEKTGISTTGPVNIQAKIKVKKLEISNEDEPVNSVVMENRIFTNLPIEIKNLNEQYEAKWNETTSLHVTGPANIIYKLTANDFKLEIDAENLNEGKHELAIIVSGPSTITWKLDQEIIELVLTKKEE